jgi:MFS family permease
MGGLSNSNTLWSSNSSGSPIDQADPTRLLSLLYQVYLPVFALESNAMSVRLPSRQDTPDTSKNLWRHPDFLKLWAGQSVSLFGSLLTRFALPLLAALLLGAGAGQMALLAAAEVVPGLLLGFVAGVWVDRLRRRPLLIAADIGRALALAYIPLAAVLGALRIEQLYVVAVLVSVCSVVFDVAYPSFLPSLLRREDLVEGNSKLVASESLAEVSGWSIAGVLVQVAGAPLAILMDAATFVVSAVSLLAIRTKELPPTVENSDERQSMAREVAQGLRFVAVDSVRRTLAAAGAVDTLFGNALGALITLYLVRDLHLAPVVIGVIYAVGGVSSFAGTLFVPRLARSWPVGRILLATMLIYTLGAFTVPLASGPAMLAVGLLILGQSLDAAHTIYSVSRLSHFQRTTPDRMQGRLHATLRVVEGCATVVGLALGGILGQTLGVRATLFVVCTGKLLGPVLLALSPVRRLRGSTVKADGDVMSMDREALTEQVGGSLVRRGGRRGVGHDKTSTRPGGCRATVRSADASCCMRFGNGRRK